MKRSEWCIACHELRVILIASKVGLVDPANGQMEMSSKFRTLTHYNAGAQLVQIMVWRMFCAKPLPEPFLTCRHLDPQEYISMIFIYMYI